MKRKIIFLGVLAFGIVLVVLFLFLQNRKKVEEKVTLDWYMDYFGSYSESGDLYMYEGYLHYIDAETGKDMFICNDASCSHDKATCSAYFETSFLKGIVEDQNLLLITDYSKENYGDLYLYETSLNGSNRRKVTLLGNNIQVLLGATITEDYVVYAYYNQYTEDFTQDLDIPKAYIGLYNRNTKTTSIICEKEMWNARIIYVNVIDQTIYYTFVGYDISREDALEHAEDRNYLKEQKISGIYSVDVEGKNDQLVVAADDPVALELYDDQFFYNNEEKLYSYNLVTGEVIEISESMVLIPTYTGNQVYFIKYDEELEKNILYSYEGTMSKIGAVSEEWYPLAIYPNVIYALRLGNYNEGSNQCALESIEAIME